MASPLALALMQGQQQATPQPAFHATAQPTDFTKANSDYNNAMMQAYSAQLGQQQGMWGGLAGLGSAGILASGSSSGPLAKLLSGSGASGAGSAALTADETASVADAMGMTAADIGAGSTWADVAPALLALLA